MAPLSRWMISFALLGALSIGVLAGLRQPARQEKKVTLAASEVLVDVVVRKKNGRPLTGLKQTDFQINEDGAPQQVLSFREVDKTAQASASEPAARIASSGTGIPNPLGTIGVIALVLDNLSAESRGPVRNAAETYVTHSLTGDDVAGVFAIGSGLKLVQPYTNNQTLLKDAIEGALATSAMSFEDHAKKVHDLANIKAAIEGKGDALSRTEGRDPSEGISLAEMAAVRQGGVDMLDMLINMEESFEGLERAEQGSAATHGLLSVIGSLANAPGRKAIILFSEGLAVPDQVTGPFQSVINAANRANVAIYAIDARGLIAEDLMASLAKEHRTIGEAGSGPMTRGLERNEDFLRRGLEANLGVLAAQTGGFLVNDTNNLIGALGRIDEDLRSHYEFTYVSSNRHYDGRFRTIAVKVDRPDVEVQARKGYYGLRANLSPPVLHFEVPGLTALENPSPSDFPFHAALLDFPNNPDGNIAVLAEAPGGAFSYRMDKAKSAYSADFSIVALIKDASGEVVKKLSQHYTPSGPAAKSPEVKNQGVLFFRQVSLPPGKYTVNIAAYDAPSSKRAVKSADVTAIDPDESNLRMSSIVIAEAAERISDDDKKNPNPFQYQDVQIYPNIGAPINKAAAQLTVFFDVYPAKGAASSIHIAADLSSQGKGVGSLNGALPPPDSTGRIQYAAGIPLSKASPGQCSLKVTASDGKHSVSRIVDFVLQ